MNHTLISQGIPSASLSHLHVHGRDGSFGRCTSCQLSAKKAMCCKTRPAAIQELECTSELHPSHSLI